MGENEDSNSANIITEELKNEIKSKSYSIVTPDARQLKNLAVIKDMDKLAVRAFRAVGKAFGMDVKLFDGKSIPGSDGVDGFYDKSTRTVYLNVTGSAKPLEATIRHEIIHHLANVAPQAYSAFIHHIAVKYKELYGNEAYETWLKAKQAEYAANGIKLNRTATLEEFAADHAMDMLQSEAIVKELVLRDRGTMQKVFDAIRTVLNKIRRALGIKETSTLSEALGALSKLSTVSTLSGEVVRSHSMFENDTLPKALSLDALETAEKFLVEAFRSAEQSRINVYERMKAVRNDNSLSTQQKKQKEAEFWEEEINSNYKTSNSNQTAFSISYDPVSHQTYVDISSTDIGGKNIKDDDSIGRKARLYLREHFRNTVLPVGKTKNAFIRSESINETTNPAKYLDDSEYKGKMLAVTELDNLLKSSEYIAWEKDNGKHPDVLRWLRYKTTFLVTVNGEKMVLRGEVKIKRIARGDCFYDITKIENITSDNMGQSIISHAAQSASDVSVYSISDNNRNVNKNNEKDSFNDRFSVSKNNVDTENKMSYNNSGSNNLKEGIESETEHKRGTIQAEKMLSGELTELLKTLEIKEEGIQAMLETYPLEIERWRVLRLILICLKRGLDRKAAVWKAWDSLYIPMQQHKMKLGPMPTKEDFLKL